MRDWNKKRKNDRGNEKLHDGEVKQNVLEFVDVRLGAANSLYSSTLGNTSSPMVGILSISISGTNSSYSTPTSSSVLRPDWGAEMFSERHPRWDETTSSCRRETSEK